MVRNGKDFYQTPAILTKLLFERETFEGDILEPCCGKGSISKLLPNCTAYDLNFGEHRKNFLFEERKFSNIITNPPYSLANEFILHCKRVATKKIALLLPLNYLHSKFRYDNIWMDKEIFPLRRVYVLTRMPQLSEEVRADGMLPARTGMMVFAWYVFEKQPTEKAPEIHFMDVDPYVSINVKNKKRKTSASLQQDAF